MKDAPINLPLLIARLREPIGFNSDGMGSSDGSFKPPSKRYDSLRLEAADAIESLIADRAGREEPTDKQIRSIYDALVSVLCDPEGKCCISGPDADRYIVDRALTDLISLCSCFRAAPSPAEPPAAPLHQEPVAHIQHSRDGVWLHLDFGLTPKLSINLSADEFTRKFALSYATKYPAQDSVLRPLYTHPSLDLRAELAEAKKACNLLEFRKIQLSEAYEREFQRAERAEAERDSLRALLQECRGGLVNPLGDWARDLQARIDASLKGTP